MIHRIHRTIVAAVLAFSGCAVQAIQVLPEPGLWRVDSEATGKPGRGFQIDKQEGRVVVITYFGYRADGTATFLQASGEQGNSSFEGDLVEYRGGTVLGNAPRDAQAAGTVGRVKIVFDSPTTGTLTLPGEPARRVSRFVYENHAARFNDVFALGVSGDGEGGIFPADAVATAQNGQFTLRVNAANAAYACSYSGTYTLAGSGIRSTGNYACPSATSGTSGTYRTEGLVVDAQGSLKGRIYRLPSGSTAETGTVYLDGICRLRSAGDGQGLSGRLDCPYPETAP